MSAPFPSPFSPIPAPSPPLLPRRRRPSPPLLLPPPSLLLPPPPLLLPSLLLPSPLLSMAGDGASPSLLPSPLLSFLVSQICTFQVEKRLKLDNPSQHTKSSSLQQQQPPVATQTNYTSIESLSTAIYVHTCSTAFHDDESSVASQAFLSSSSQSSPSLQHPFQETTFHDTKGTREAKSDDFDDIQRLMQLLGLSEGNKDGIFEGEARRRPWREGEKGGEGEEEGGEGKEEGGEWEEKVAGDGAEEEEKGRGDGEKGEGKGADVAAICHPCGCHVISSACVAEYSREYSAMSAARD